ncbi:hypothetical protein JWG45_07605 [Leptospira sp. 201903070]|uniref:Uncharacterized protein n=1 Tax=Leptospira ainlahdjerensis TaxID=2810033 RepID=A0ABS2UAP8_9LEPT|nr:hypothetical protein [Leptospira ainlahdjerensis]MBM9577018.1 hypothetical protein [Leptospira ainlahdjerensis]
MFNSEAKQKQANSPIKRSSKHWNAEFQTQKNEKETKNNFLETTSKQFRIRPELYDK